MSHHLGGFHELRATHRACPHWSSSADERDDDPLSEQGVQYAEAHGVPAASVLVPLSGVIAIVGALSIITGYRTKVGAWLLVLFLLPVTFMMHDYWTVTDPMQQHVQMVMFFKNLGLLGGVLLLAYYGAGPISLDQRKQ